MAAGVVKEFCHHTTVHGIAFVARQNFLPFKLFWSFVVISAFTGLSLHLYSIVNSYLQYKSTESTYEKRNGFTFPDVTICNLNGISHSNLKSAAKKYSKVKHFYEVLMKGNISGDAAVKYMSVTPKDLFWALDNEAVHIGHKSIDMILSCKFERKNCYEESFVLFHFSSFFNCYTFTGGRNSGLFTNYGQGAGLSLILYMEPGDPNVIEDYDKGFTTGGASGFRVLLTPTDYLPAIGNGGYDMEPGHLITIGFNIREQIRLPEPYSHCGETRSTKFGSSIPFTFVECRNMCIHKIVMDNCGCVSTKYITRSRENGKSCVHYLFTNKTKSDELMTCEDKFAKINHTNFQDLCNCHWPCDDMSYPAIMSHSLWPNRKSLESFIEQEILNHPKWDHLKAYQHYQKLKSSNATRDEIYEWVSSHFLKLIVYAQSNIVSVKEQIPMYTPTDLLCQVGGCLGLWVGMSVITLVEILDLFVNVLSDIFSFKKSNVK